MLEEITALDLLDEPEAPAAFSERYAYDPVLFAEEICGIELDDPQKGIAQDVADYRLNAEASAMGCGKSFVAALLAFWFLATRPFGKVVLTSAKFEQTTTVLSPYLRRLIAQSAIRSWFDVSSQSVKWAGAPEAGSVFVWSWNANNPSSARGQHADEMLIICDEASGIDDAILAALFGTLTGLDNRMLLISNPSRIGGFFAECFSDPRWHTRHISSAESRWASKESAERNIARYGLESDFVRVNVLGQFPLESSSSIIGLQAIERFLSGAVPPLRSDVQGVLGLDVGAGGDWTVWAIRYGNRFEVVRKDKTQDLQDLVRITAEIVRTRANVGVVNVDSTGVGVFVPGALRRVVSCRIVSCNFGEASPEPDCANFRTWIYRRLGDALFESDCGLEGGDKALLKKELALAEYEIDRLGRKALVPKAKISSAIGCSPDEADALALTCAIRGDLFASVVAERQNTQASARAFRAAAKW